MYRAVLAAISYGSERGETTSPLNGNLSTRVAARVHREGQGPQLPSMTTSRAQ